MHPRGAINRFFSDGLSPEDESRLRGHLVGCGSCRADYDEQVLLLRALEGKPAHPTRSEVDGSVRRALVAAGLPVAVLPNTPKATSWFGLFFGEPLRVGLASLALVVVLIAAGLVLLPRKIAPPPSTETPGLAQAMTERPARATSELAGRLLRARGVSVDSREVTEGSSVYSGVPLTVASSGLAELQLECGGRAHLFPGAQITLSPRGDTVEVGTGKVWFEVAKESGPFTVRTDSALVRVLGSSFVVERVPNGDTEIRVAAGEADVEDLGHRGAVVVRRAQKAMVRVGSAPSALSSYRPEDDLSAWSRFWKQLGGQFDRALSKVGRVIDGLLGH